MLQLQLQAGMFPCLGVLDHCAGDGHALLLPAAQRDAALAQLQKEGQGRQQRSAARVDQHLGHDGESTQILAGSTRSALLAPILATHTMIALYCLSTLPYSPLCCTAPAVQR